ncbi:MAG: indolepyruvate ferredoxin oxidoreductase subunit alpha [Planctomycetaceae bacterium]|jgi:indolepyruvate ferredoxin oxidoreductase alpha subunit|nr:indolepyruvate ferredoxin oxidoreductase subunit alpha [Planctomycetaceae bacterium]
MSKTILSGNEAFARGAWEAGVTFAAGYPGTPSTEILENVAAHYKKDIYCEWAPNEKVAFEAAIGAAFSGARAITTMKHVGLNVAADPLMTLSYIGTVGGFAAIVADDPGMHSSQNEQDTRRFAQFAKIPVFEPSDSQETKDFMKIALTISENFRTPILMRSTTRVSHSRSLVEFADRQLPERPIGFEKDPPRFVPIPAWARAMRQRVEERLHQIQQSANLSLVNRIEWRNQNLGIVTSGMTYQYVREVFPEASVLKLGCSYPFPDELIQKFAAGVEHLLIIEELEDFLEEHIKALGIACLGKSLVPNIGELSADVLHTVRAKLDSKISGSKEGSAALPQTAKAVSIPAERTGRPVPPSRPPVLCPGCPHRGIFFGLTKFDVVVTGDIGCYSLGVLPPLDRMDTIVCMGGGISVAHGMDRAGEPKPVVGIVGDSTFFHSGITGLMDIAYNKGKSTIIVLDNRTTAMTGHQENPGTGKTLMEEPTGIVSIEDVGRAVGVKNIVTIDPRNMKQIHETLKKAIDSPEAWLIVAKAPCPLYEKKNPGPPLELDKEKCRKCKLCLKLGCPAIEKDGDEISINRYICAGCTLCQQTCSFGCMGEISQ